MQKAPFHSTIIRHHPNGSHTIRHVPHTKHSKSGAFVGHEGAETSYSAEHGQALMDKLHHHLQIAAHDGGDEPADEMEETEQEA